MKTKALGLICIVTISFTYGNLLCIAQVPTGYYDNAQGLEGDELRVALHNQIKGHTRVSYNSIWDHFYKTDRKSDTTVWDMYSDIPSPGTPPYTYRFFQDQCRTIGRAEGACYVREHSFPKNYWGGGSKASDTMYYDLFHIIPTDSWVNGHRSNHPYGVVAGPATTLNGGKRGPNAYSFEGTAFIGTVFEPTDAYKGDLARNYFYMATRYLSRLESWNSYSPVIKNGDLAPWVVAMMTEWHVNDPVSQKEISRNDSIFTIQGNRNPFIDHPEYVHLIWKMSQAGEPLSHAANLNATAITLTWTDPATTPLPEGYLIICSSTGFDSISNPVDGIVKQDGQWHRNVTLGVQEVVFGGLNAGTTYYFKLFSYRYNNGVINYKVDGDVPKMMVVAK